MLIEFDRMQAVAVDAPRGGKGRMLRKEFADENDKIMEIRLTPGSSIGLHTHEADSEMFYVISGAGKVLYDGAYETLSAGACHFCPKGHSHSLINDGDRDLVVLAIIPRHP